MERSERSYRRDRGTAIPPFSSCVLDEIYRSIDERGNGQDFATLGAPRAQLNPIRKSHHHLHRHAVKDDITPDRVVLRRREADTGYDQKVLSSRRKPKPVRTGPPPDPESSIRIRFRSSKIYSDTKKAKAPVSPGARLAGFLNNLFTATGNTKKANLPRSSRVPAIAGEEEDSNCHQECLHGRRDIARAIPIAAVKVRETPYLAAEERRRTTADLEFREEMEAEEFDDVASCSSSDLFELENLTAIGGEKFRDDELPVFETTHLDKYRAISQGLIV